MTTFSDAAAELLADSGVTDLRRRAWTAYEQLGLPTTADEVWRYAPLGAFAIDDYAPANAPASGTASELAMALAERAGLVVRLVDGFLEDALEVEGITVSRRDDGASLGGQDLDERYRADAFALLNTALSPGTVSVRVEPGVQVAAPLVVLNEVRASAAFPRLQVDVGAGANVTLVECLDGGAGSLVVPLSEYRVGANAALQVVTYQRLDASSWHVARSGAFLERDARLRQAVVGVGSRYDRSRNDAELLDTGASNELRTTYLGAADQVHDFRTHQLHLAPRTSSTLLAKGAVADRSRSIYTGLIEIEKGAKRTDARQTNRNLLLSPSAHADSVPNLEIRENDVVCAHASSVGPLDEMELWYLESRGVERVQAEHLMIRGFYNEMMVALPSEIAPLIEADVAAALAAVSVVAP